MTSCEEVACGSPPRTVSNSFRHGCLSPGLAGPSPQGRAGRGGSKGLSGPDAACPDLRPPCEIEDDRSGAGTSRVGGNLAKRRVRGGWASRGLVPHLLEAWRGPPSALSTPRSSKRALPEATVQWLPLTIPPSFQRDRK